jgi:hypothetical protein
MPLDYPFKRHEHTGSFYNRTVLYANGDDTVTFKSKTTTKSTI